MTTAILPEIVVGPRPAVLTDTAKMRKTAINNIPIKTVNKRRPEFKKILEGTAEWHNIKPSDDATR
jgi:hypothetical protein